MARDSTTTRMRSTVYWQTGERLFERTFASAEKTELARDLLKLVAERFEIAYSAGEYAIN